MWAWLRVRWLSVLAVVLVVMLLIGGKCYGDAQYREGVAVAKAVVADSIGKAYEARFTALHDSVDREMASFRAEVVAANARAAAADARAAMVLNSIPKVLTPDVIARTDPRVLALIDSMRVSIVGLSSSNLELSAKLATATDDLARASRALALADSTIVVQDSTIADYRKLKVPAHGFWHTVVRVAEVGGLILTGGLIGHAIK